jgi:hypothetical protein
MRVDEYSRPSPVVQLSPKRPLVMQDVDATNAYSHRRRFRLSSNNFISSPGSVAVLLHDFHKWTSSTIVETCSARDPGTTTSKRHIL